jgi:hypothetical protein
VSGAGNLPFVPLHRSAGIRTRSLRELLLIQINAFQLVTDSLANQGEKAMNRPCTLRMMVISVLCLGFGLGASDLRAQQAVLKQELIGTWVLVSNDNVAADGIRRQLFGPSPKGIFIIDANGRYAQIQINPNRPKFKASTRMEGTPEENKAVVQATSASFGTWSVNEADKVLILHAEASMFPNFDGTDSKRSVTLTGDRLKYTNPTASGGGTAEAVYERTR